LAQRDGRISTLTSPVISVEEARDSHIIFFTVPPRLADSLITVGDWVLIEHAAPRVQRLIAPYSVIKRHVAGSDHRLQSIAANLDTLFIVTSCNGAR
jgi:hypothetical protein